MPCAIHPAGWFSSPGYGPPSRRPLRWGDAGCHSTGVGGWCCGVGGTHSASDTPRSMSGMWSQCPWGSPALRGVVQSRPLISPALGDRRPLIRHGLYRPCHLPPQGEGRAGFCCRLPFTRPGGFRYRGTGRRVVGPYGGVVAVCHSFSLGCLSPPHPSRPVGPCHLPP